MEKNIDDIEKVIENIKITEKKGNRLCDDKKRKKKRKKEHKQKQKVDGTPKAKENVKKKFKLSKKKVGITILIVLALLILTIGTIAGTYVYKADGDIATAALNMAADVLGEDDPIFVLVLGLSEDISAALTDTIILAGYNPDSQKAFMLSIPRDTFVGKNEAWAGGYDKINALYQTSPEKTVEAVEKLTGIDIAHYVLVKNTALPAIVSAIGEVEFNVPIDMDYDDPTQNLHIHLKAGTQMIDGNEAEQLLRFRHNNDGSSYPTEYGDNDYGRMRTQREFIKAVASQLISGNSTANLKKIATAVFDNVTTDMSLTKILSYAPSAIKLNMDGIRMEQLPGASAKLNNLWFYKHDSIETYDLINELLTELALDEKELEQFYTPTKKVKNTTTQKTTTTETTGTTNISDTTPAQGTTTSCTHANSTSRVIVEPTCEGKGQEVITCSCGKTETREIPATGHNIRKVETTSGTTKTITETCTNAGCGYKNTKTEKVTSGKDNANINNSENNNQTEDDKKTPEQQEKPDTNNNNNQGNEEPPASQEQTSPETTNTTNPDEGQGSTEQTPDSTPTPTPTPEETPSTPTTPENSTEQTTGNAVGV